MKLLLATRSAHKLAEIRAILASVPELELLDPQGAGIPETAEEAELERFRSFEANAVAKARFFQQTSGLPTLADDSGLVVDALSGEPGVRSKRFAGQEWLEPQTRDRRNNERLLERLRETPLPQRTARYVCVAALAFPDGQVHTFRGEAQGLILDAPRGTGGFGYDPLFYDPDTARTFAELTPAEKNRRSHRGKAFRAAAEFLTRRAGLEARSRA